MAGKGRARLIENERALHASIIEMNAVLALLALGSFQLRADDPLLIKERNLTCADWAKVANHYIAIGEDKAVADLIERSSSQPPRFAISNKHACHIARLIYSPKPDETLRPPRLGHLYSTSAIDNPNDWSRFPFAYQNGVIFLLGDRYQLAGEPEQAADYLAYVKANGTFRKLAYPVPTAKQAEAALEKLIDSAAAKESKLSGSFLRMQIEYR